MKLRVYKMLSKLSITTIIGQDVNTEYALWEMSVKTDVYATRSQIGNRNVKTQGTVEHNFNKIKILTTVNQNSSWQP